MIVKPTINDQKYTEQTNGDNTATEDNKTHRNTHNYALNTTSTVRPTTENRNEKIVC